MSFGQLFVLSTNNSHIFFAPPKVFYKTRPVLYMNKSFGYNENKKLSSEAQKQRVIFLEKQNITSPLAMLRIRSRIILVSQILISIKEKSQIRIQIWIRIRIQIRVKVGSTSPELQKCSFFLS
jgi:hypothetical protein